MKRAWSVRSTPQIAKGVVASALLLAIWPSFASARQAQQQGPPSSRSPVPGFPVDEAERVPGSNAMKLEHMREDERRKRLLADTAKLLQLSTELREQVNKSAKDELSLDVVRKAAEIEKLARDVKERMKS